MVHVHEVKLPAQMTPGQFVVVAIFSISMFILTLNIDEFTKNWFLIAVRYFGLASGMIFVALVVNVVFGKVKIVKPKKTN